jgi:AraC-like DNA-binding protein
MIGPGSDPVLFRGSALSKDQCVVLDTGAEAELVSHGQFFGTAIAVSNDAWQAASHWLGDRSTAAENRAHLESPGMQWIESVQADANTILDACIRYPEGAMSSSVGIAMEELVLASLTASKDCTRRPSDNRSQRARRRIAVQRARAYIDENLANPIRLSEVCAHARAQARSLEYGFHEMLGITPVSYIKAVRLNRVRRLLLSSVLAERTITEIALDCGFWHLSQFSMDYKIFFGESPSVTGRRTVAQRSRHGRRLSHS